MNLSKKIILSTATDFFARGDMILMILCLIASFFGVVVISSATLEGRRDRLMQAVARAVRPDSVFIEDELALIAVVGRGMVKAKGTAARVCDALARADVNIRMIDQGSSELNIIVGVDDEAYESALQAIYAEFVKA